MDRESKLKQEEKRTWRSPTLRLPQKNQMNVTAQ